MQVTIESTNLRPVHNSVHFCFVQPKNVARSILFQYKISLLGELHLFPFMRAECAAIAYTGVSSSWHCTSISRTFYVGSLLMSGSMPTMPLIRPIHCRSKRLRCYCRRPLAGLQRTQQLFQSAVHSFAPKNGDSVSTSNTELKIFRLRNKRKCTTFWMI